MKKLIILSLLLTIICLAFLVNAENLYDEKSFQPLVSDNKAFRVGDSLTVIVVEAAKAESRALTGSKQSIGLSANIQDNVASDSVSANVGANSGGDAVTSRHGFLSAQLAVTVNSISENNLLEISGEQSIIINGEEQKIMISGSVRREDINKDNTVISNRLTNAKIEFFGDGVVGDAQNTGILYKIFQWLGLV